MSGAMINRPGDQAIKRLPKWAQAYISTLESRVAVLESRNIDPDGKVFVESVAGTVMSFPTHVVLRYNLNSDNDIFRISFGESGVIIRSIDGALRVQPLATNAVLIWKGVYRSSR